MITMKKVFILSFICSLLLLLLNVVLDYDTDEETNKLLSSEAVSNQKNEKTEQANVKEMEVSCFLFLAFNIFVYKYL